MKNRISRLFALAAAVVLLCAFDKTWTRYTSDEARLSVMLPEEPKLATSVEKTAAGEITLWQASVIQEARAYFVVYNDLPESTWKSDPKKMLLAARDGAAKRSRGKIVADRAIKLANRYPGREFKLVLDKMELTQRVYVVGHRLYQIHMGCLVGTCSAKEVQAYLDSLKIGK